MADQKKHILIVEDEESLVYIIRRVFRTASSRFEAKVVGTLQEALSACEEYLPDLIIADLLLPDGKGIELCSADFKGRTVPIVIMTGYEDERLAKEAKEKGAIDYIMKTESNLLELPRIADRALREWHYIEQYHEASCQKGELEHELEIKKTELEYCISKVCSELKDPLDTIEPFVRIAGNGFKSKKKKISDKEWDITIHALKKIHRTINELIEYDRYRKLEDEIESVDLGSVAKKVVKLLSRPGKGFEPEAVVADNLPVIPGYKDWILQLFIRLFDNAVKYTQNSSSAKISIDVQNVEGESVVVIQDNGIGIHPKYHQRIFGLFEKLNPDSEGLGIGLAICKRIVEAHGGRLWVESEGYENGNRFCFTWDAQAMKKNLNRGEYG